MSVTSKAPARTRTGNRALGPPDDRPFHHGGGLRKFPREGSNLHHRLRRPALSSVELRRSGDTTEASRSKDSGQSKEHVSGRIRTSNAGFVVPHDRLLHHGHAGWRGFEPAPHRWHKAPHLARLPCDATSPRCSRQESNLQCLEAPRSERGGYSHSPTGARMPAGRVARPSPGRGPGVLLLNQAGGFKLSVAREGVEPPSTAYEAVLEPLQSTSQLVWTRRDSHPYLRYATPTSSCSTTGPACVE